jgi:cytochrome c-type biogenesis protein
MTLSLSALLLAGFLTFLSPCVLPLIPVYLAMLAGTSAASLREGGGRGKVVLAAVAFSMGLAAVFVTLGLAASAMGRAVSGHRPLLLQLAGLAVFLAGLKLTGIIQIPALDRENRPWLASVRRGSGLLWPFLFGAAFALGWSPCVGPTLASALALAASTNNAGKAALYLAVYSLGLALPLIAVATVAPAALRLLDRAKRYFRVVEVTSGALLAAVGLMFITGHASAFMGQVGTTTAASADVAAVSPGPATCGAGVTGAAEQPAPSVAQAAVEQMPTMTEFVSATCPICRRMAPVVAKAEQDCSAHGVRIRQLDVATGVGREAANRYGILGVPTFVFVDQQGTEVARLVGEQPEETLIQTLEVLAGQTCDGFHRLGNAPSAGS